MVLHVAFWIAFSIYLVFVPILIHLLIKYFNKIDHFIIRGRSLLFSLSIVLSSFILSTIIIVILILSDIKLINTNILSMIELIINQFIYILSSIIVYRMFQIYHRSIVMYFVVFLGPITTINSYFLFFIFYFLLFYIKIDT